MTFFETFLLLSFSLKLNKFLKDNGYAVMTNCECYKKYRPRENFFKTVIDERQSYMACLKYEMGKKYNYEHCCIPVLFGTWIDYLIRDDYDTQIVREQWCQVMIHGISKLYMSFSTFDALSMHARLSGGQMSIEWYFYVDKEGVALSYRNQVVEVKYKKIKMTSDSDSWIECQKWLELINEANPFKEEMKKNGQMYNQTSEKYFAMFNTILSYPYDMNDLKNRQFISVVSIFNKIIEYTLNRKKRTDKISIKKIANHFEDGNFFTFLSKKSSYEGAEWSKNYPQSYDNALQYGRSNKTAHFLPTVTRASNEAFRNSSALAYPNDGYQFLCMVNTKDIKSVGEHNVLSDFVIMTEETPELKVFEFLYKWRTPTGKFISIINGFLVDIRFDWSFDRFICLKNTFPFITTKYYKPYIYFFTKASIPIKYSDVYDICFSPAEVAEYFGNSDNSKPYAFKDDSQFSTTAKALGTWALLKNQPAKTTVAINNLKGSVANVTSDFHKKIMTSSQGITCYIEINETLKQKILDTAILETNAQPNCEYFREIENFMNIHYEMKQISKTNYEMAQNFLQKSYNLNDLMYVCEKQTNPTQKAIGYHSILMRERVLKWGSMIFNEENYDPPNPWNLKAWVGFGNYKGCCIEDGVVLDKKFVENIPPIYYNACISVDFTFNRVKSFSKTAIFVPVNDLPFSNDALVGCVVTNCMVNVKNSRHCTVLYDVIGNHYYYLIFFLPKEQNVYEQLTVSYVQNSKMLTVLIKGQHTARMTIGSKIANSFGQKNVCSAIEDLSEYTCITRDGRKVHPQVLYNEVSVVGRMLVGQLLSTFDSKDLAFGDDKQFIAPLDLVIHSIHPYTNTKAFKIKIDTLVNANGFDSQALSSVTLAMRKIPVSSTVEQLINMHGFRLIDRTNDVTDDD